ncbi:MAG: hypothetical protein M3Q05_09095 [Bacteroidota bacterium]|nr:hypothetical protein [Bacteroidota bacterium]
MKKIFLIFLATGFFYITGCESVNTKKDTSEGANKETDGYVTDSAVSNTDTTDTPTPK